MATPNGSYFLVSGSDVSQHTALYKNTDGVATAIVQMRPMVDDIFDVYQRRREFFEECCKIMFGGYVVLALLTMACRIIAALPPYVVQ